jgi:hypothetical protein
MTFKKKLDEQGYEYDDADKLPQFISYLDVLAAHYSKEGWKVMKVYDGDDRLSQRTLIKGVGLTDEDLKKPLIAIANSWNEINPGHIHLNEIAKHVKHGVIQLVLRI